MAEEGSKKKNHKYIARVELPKKTKKQKYRYFYTIPEYQTYLKTKNKSTNILRSEVLTKFPDYKPNQKKYPLPNPNRIVGKEEMRKYADEGKKVIDKIVKTETRPLSELVNKFSSAGKKFMDSVKSVVEKVSNVIDYVKDYYNDKKNGFSVLDYYTDTNDSKKEEAPKKPKETFEYDENGVRLKTREFTKDEDMAVINPNYVFGDEEYLTNCAYCATAWDLRQRGYDVEAKPADPNVGITLLTLDTLYDGAKVTKPFGYKYDEERDITLTRKISPNPVESDPRDEGRDIYYKDAARSLENELERCGKGARGILAFNWTAGSAHAVAWEIDDRGSLVVRDAQVNKAVTLEYYLQYAKRVSYCRVDNLEPTQRAFDLVKNRGE